MSSAPGLETETDRDSDQDTDLGAASLGGDASVEASPPTSLTEASMSRDSAAGVTAEGVIPEAVRQEPPAPDPNDQSFVSALFEGAELADLLAEDAGVRNQSHPATAAAAQALAALQMEQLGLIQPQDALEVLDRCCSEFRDRLESLRGRVPNQILDDLIKASRKIMEADGDLTELWASFHDVTKICLERVRERHKLADFIRDLKDGEPENDPGIEKELERELEEVFTAINRSFGARAGEVRAALSASLKSGLTRFCEDCERQAAEKSLSSRLGRAWSYAGRYFKGESSQGGQEHSDKPDRSRRSGKTGKLHGHDDRRHGKGHYHSTIDALPDEDQEDLIGLSQEQLEAAGEEARSEELQELHRELQYNQRSLATGTDPSHMFSPLTVQERGEIVATIQRIKNDLRKLGDNSGGSLP